MKTFNFKIIIPTFNRRDILFKCIDSVLVALESTDAQAQIIVVVNDTLDYIDSNLSYLERFAAELAAGKIVFLRGGPKVYWTKSIILGLKYKKELDTFIDGIFLVNDDTIVPADIFREFLELPLNNVKVCNVFSQLQLVYETQILNVNLKKFDIDLISNSNHIGNAATARFVFYPAKSILMKNYLFSLLIPHYLGDIYFSFRAWSNNYRIQDVPNISVTTLDRIYSNSTKNVPFMIKRFSIKSPDRLLSLIFFWSFVIWKHFAKLFSVKN
jgi:hypothetical protein